MLRFLPYMLHIVLIFKFGRQVIFYDFKPDKLFKIIANYEDKVESVIIDSVDILKHIKKENAEP